MTIYSVRLYSDQIGDIHNKKIECHETEIPVRLVRAVMDCLKDAPYHDIVLARVSAGRNTVTYMVSLDDDTADVYCRVFREDMAGVRDRHAEFTAPPDRDEDL